MPLDLNQLAPVALWRYGPADNPSYDSVTLEIDDVPLVALDPFVFAALVEELREARARESSLSMLLTTAYDLVAESIEPTRQYDYTTRAKSLVESARSALAGKAAKS